MSDDKKLTDAEKEAKAEEKEKKALEKAKAKMFDEKDECFCGFLELGIADEDGYGRKTKGAKIKGPLFLASEPGADPVVLEAEFAMNPLFYMQVPNEEGQLVCGNFWIGEKSGPLTNICEIIPKLCTTLTKEMEKAGNGECTVDAQMPLLRNAPSKLVKVTITTKEQKFITKVAKVSVKIPKDYWTEFKNHRIRFWQYGKNQSGASAGGGGGGDDKDEKKEE